MDKSFVLEEKSAVLMLDKPTSIGITTSIPNVMEKGFPLWTSYMWSNKPITQGNSSAHSPLALSNLYFNPLIIALFVASA